MTWATNSDLVHYCVGGSIVYELCFCVHLYSLEHESNITSMCSTAVHVCICIDKWGGIQDNPCVTYGTIPHQRQYNVKQTLSSHDKNFQTWSLLYMF